MGGAWAVFGDSDGQAQTQPQVMPPQQQQPAQQQQEQPLAPEPVVAQPPKPAPRQELPLVSIAWASAVRLVFADLLLRQSHM